MIYNTALCLLFLVLGGKTVRNSLKRRHAFRRFFVPKLPKLSDVFWIHAVSLGEVHAAKGLIQKLQATYPDLPIVLSSSTNTGIQAAKAIKGIKSAFILPLDFSFLMRPLVQKLRPKALVLVESDYWKNLLYYAKKEGATIGLVSGKMSMRSQKRLATFSFWSRHIFSYFDAILVQNTLYKSAFIQANAPKKNIHITGNIKYGAAPKPIDSSTQALWRKKLHIEKGDLVLTIASTHAPEESLLLDQLSILWKALPHLKVLLAPRHPERFSEVARLFTEKQYDYIRYSNLGKKKSNLILIDTMGFLPVCYTLSNAAFVGGSYTQHVGGHNILEPIFCKAPVFYGPYMHSQKEMQELVEKYRAGSTIAVENWAAFFLEFFQDIDKQKTACLHGEQLVESLSATVDQTLHALQQTGVLPKAPSN